MNRSLRTWQALLLPLTCILLWALPAQSAHAKVSCSVTSSPNVTFGNVDLVNGVPPFTTAATLNYSCTNTSQKLAYAKVCFNVGIGTGGGTYSPRTMKSGTNILQFQLYQPGTMPWGDAANLSPYIVSIPVPGKVGSQNGSYSDTVTMTGTLVNGQTAPTGIYTSSFSGAAFSITLTSDTNSPPTTCTTVQAAPPILTATATVIKSCKVTVASNINLGSVPSTAVNTSGANNISVTCANTTPYFIGLAPSNGSNTGAGTMSGTGSNTDKVPYQLNSVSAAGPIWGNTATSTSVGNGVAGIGTGLAQTIPVYAKAPGANYTPDTYSDTVTVNVNY